MRIILPLSSTIPILIFGLTKYYTSAENEKQEAQDRADRPYQNSVTNIILVTIFILVLLIVIFFPSTQAAELFISWEHIDIIHIVKIAAAVLLSFFLPGYLLVMILDKEHRLKESLRLLLAYCFSILITGLTGYIGASFGYELALRQILIVSPSIIILVLFVVQSFGRSNVRIHSLSRTFYCNALSRAWRIIRRKNSELLIFGSLFVLVILFTYYLNNGKIVVDQWFYHGRAILMNSVAYRDLSTAETYSDSYESKISDVNEINPPFFSALLSAFFNLSGSPSVNSYVSINFLNIIPVFAFYLFYVSWTHKSNQRAVMLGITFFVLSSGFGWVYALYSATQSGPIISAASSVNILSNTTERTYDVGLPTTFLGVGHPDITTPLIVVALPAGFVLLGLLGQIKSIYNNNHEISSNHGNIVLQKRTRYFSVLILVLITAISFLGILAHDEFYLFIIIASTVILFGNSRINANYSIFFASFLSAILLVTLVDYFISPIKYYTEREILGLPLVELCFLYVCVLWIVYLTVRKVRISNISQTSRIFKWFKSIIPQMVSKHHGDRRNLKVALRIATASLIAYLYLFTLFVWTQVSLEDTRSYIKDQWNVPWYLYPMKFGLMGILSIAFVVSYIFKKFEKEIFVFGIVALIAFLAGPYYDEHRFGKYIMVSMDVFASLLIYQIISSSISHLKLNVRSLTTGILLGLTVVASSLSVLIFAGYIELLSSNTDYLEGGRRDFPTSTEWKLLNFLHDKVVNSGTYNIAVPEKEVDYSRGLITKIYGFSGIPRVKLLQNPLTLNASTPDGFYKLLADTDTSYIVLPKNEILAMEKQEKILSSPNNKILQFAKDNFPMVYQDKSYVVLEVPSISPPSKDFSNVGLIYQRDADLLFQDLNTLVLPYSNKSFDLVTDNNITNNALNKGIDASSKGSTIVVSDYGNDNINNNTGMIVWSHPIDQIQEIQKGPSRTTNINDSHNKTVTNYIEASFRIMNSTSITKGHSEKIKSNDYDAGLLWEYQNKEYQLLIRKNGLELLTRPITTMELSKSSKEDTNINYDPNSNNNEHMSSTLLSQNQEVKREKGIWYNLKILLLKNSINVYVNNMLKIKLPILGNLASSASMENSILYDKSISRIGLRAFLDQVEFQPLSIGKMPELSQLNFKSYEKQKEYSRHYYPLSILALSNIKYDTFVDNDWAVFSKRYVILPFDPPTYEETTIGKYLEFAKNGGNLIVINSDNDNLRGVFAKLMSIRSGNHSKFDAITPAFASSSKHLVQKNRLNVSGVAQNIIFIPSSNDTNIKSYYTSRINQSNYQKMVAPFSIEKSYGKGKIIFVNAVGYFDAIFKDSSKKDTNNKDSYFMSLGKIFGLMNLVESKDNHQAKINSSVITSAPATRITGDLKIASDETAIANSSSLLFPYSDSIDKLYSYDMAVKELSISKSNKISILSHNDSNITSDFNSINKALNYSSSKTNTLNDTSSKLKIGNVIIRNLKLYGGPFEVIINSTNNKPPIQIPSSYSYNDYIGVSVPIGFDVKIKLPKKSAYVEFEVIKADQKKLPYQTIRILSTHNNSGTNSNANSNSKYDIYLHKVNTDLGTIKYISILMKNPQITVLKEGMHSNDMQTGMGNMAISFNEDSHKGNPIEVKSDVGNITAKFSYVDNYNSDYRTGIRTQFLTYLDQDIRIISDDGSIHVPADLIGSEKQAKIQIPGDISEFAKQHGMQLPWKKELSGNTSIILGISVVIITIMMSRFLPNVRKLSKNK